MHDAKVPLYCRSLTIYRQLSRNIESTVGNVLARGVSDGEGRLELHGTWRNWTSKFWLVSGEDVGAGDKRKGRCF